MQWSGVKRDTFYIWSFAWERIVPWSSNRQSSTDFTHKKDTESVQNEISRDSQVEPLYKDGRENKPVKDRRSQESLPNFSFQSFLAGKDLSCTNETGHKRNRLDTTLLYRRSVSPRESYSETECSDEHCYSTSLSSEQAFQAGPQQISQLPWDEENRLRGAHTGRLGETQTKRSWGNRATIWPKKRVSSTSNREEGAVEQPQLRGNWVSATKQESCKSVKSVNQV